MGKIIATALPKGGVGKTNTAVNLSFTFAIKNKRTLLIDLDPACSCTSFMGFTSDNIKGDIFNVFNYTKSVAGVTHKTSHEMLSFIPLKNLNYKDEVRLTKLANNQSLLRNLLRPEAMQYDFVIIDCPPYLIGLTTDDLIAADSVLTPVMAGKFSMDAVERLLDHINYIKRNFNQHISIEGILLTNYEFNTRISFKAKKELFEKYPELMFRTVIPKNVVVMESTFKQIPSIIYNPSAKSSAAYMQLADEIIEKNLSGYYRVLTEIDVKDTIKQKG